MHSPFAQKLLLRQATQVTEERVCFKHALRLRTEPDLQGLSHVDRSHYDGKECEVLRN